MRDSFESYAKMLETDRKGQLPHRRVPGTSPIVVSPAPIMRPKATSSGTAQFVTGLLALVTVVGGGVIYSQHQRETPAAKNGPNSAATSEAVRPSSASVPVVSALAQPSQSSAPPQVQANLPAKKPVAAKPQAAKPAPNSEKPEVVVDAKMTATFATAVANVRASLAKRDLAAAGKQIKVASANAQTQEDRVQVDRLETMLDSLTQFWKGIHDAMAKLQAAEEIPLQGNRIIVIESKRNLLTVKFEGRIHRFQAENMPASLVMALVDQFFGKDVDSKAIIGTFLAVDPNGDRALAKRYWQEASRAGIDSEKLLPELNVPLLKR